MIHSLYAQEIKSSLFGIQANLKEKTTQLSLSSKFKKPKFKNLDTKVYINKCHTKIYRKQNDWQNFRFRTSEIVNKQHSTVKH